MWRPCVDNSEGLLSYLRIINIQSIINFEMLKKKPNYISQQTIPLYQGSCYQDFSTHEKKLMRPLIVSQNGQMWDRFFLMTGNKKNPQIDLVH